MQERFEPGLGDAVLAPTRDLPSARRSRQRASCRSADNFQGIGLRRREAYNKVLRELEADIDAVTLDDHDVPVEAESVLFAVRAAGEEMVDAADRQLSLHHAARAPQSIRDAVHGDLKRSQTIWSHVDAIARRLGADPQDQVPFAKYAEPPKACSSRHRPRARSRAARPSSSASTCW